MTLLARGYFIEKVKASIFNFSCSKKLIRFSSYTFTEDYYCGHVLAKKEENVSFQRNADNVLYFTCVFARAHRNLKNTGTTFS